MGETEFVIWVGNSVAQIIGSVIGKTILYISYIFAYQYRISTMTEKAADTDKFM